MGRGESAFHITWADAWITWHINREEWPFKLPEEVERLAALWAGSTFDMELDEFLARSTGVPTETRLRALPTVAPGLFGRAT